MEDKISYIVKNDRFPLSRMDKIFLISIFVVVAALGGIGISMVDGIAAKIIIPIFLIGLCYIIYSGYTSSLSFKKIPTGFDKEQNRMLVVYCLGGLNIKPFKSELYDNVFVCFVHNNGRGDRQEIYIVAKDEFVLIHTNKEKESDAPPGAPDLVGKIGSTIFTQAKHFRSRVVKN